MLHQRTWAEIDLDALSRNLAAVRALAGTGVEVMLVLKADAYGHGAVPVAWHLVRQGVPILGVGDSTEALELRAAGITAPILILGAVVAGEMEDVIRGGILVTVHSSDRVRALRRAAERSQSRVGVHLKVDTGMGRLGCHPKRAVGIAREVERSRRLHLQGVCTHLASTEPASTQPASTQPASTQPGAAHPRGKLPDGSVPGGKGETARQLARFRSVLAALEKDGIRPPWRHAYASNALLAGLTPEFNLVRPGLALYGVSADSSAAAASRLVPALSWRTQIVFLKDHPRGSRIGYGGTFTTRRASRVATLPVGYSDGYRFAFSNNAEVLVRGRRCPVVGRVSMDYVTVDVTDVAGARVGDVVTLLGADGTARIPVEELATRAQTIPYEIFCGIGRRVRRIYTSASAQATGPTGPLHRDLPEPPGATEEA